MKLKISKENVQRFKHRINPIDTENSPPKDFPKRRLTTKEISEDTNTLPKKLLRIQMPR